MKKTITIIVLLILIILTTLYIQKTPETNSNIVTKDQAILLIKQTYPEYQDYPSDNLPPKSIEIMEIYDGWRVGMYTEGSGVPGILKANCFIVTQDGVVKETGLFQGEGPAQDIDLYTCTPKE